MHILNKFLCILSLSCSLVLSQNVVQLETKTGDGDDDGMTAGNIDIELYNNAFVRCTIENMDASGNTFKKGNIDTFQVCFIYSHCL